MLLSKGSTCHDRLTADRISFLIDAAPYFDHLVDALEQARRSILIVGWDIHSQTRLRRGEGVDEERYRLGPLLDRLARKRPDLHIHLLAWDFAMFYAFEREVLQRYRLGWKSHRRVHFELDGNHPIGACHHQKIVAIDDQLAFLGGLDLTRRRWDTHAHEPDDELRVDPDGNPYPPFHDVQIAVSGPPARALGDLVRNRWHQATGRRLKPPRSHNEIWPERLDVDLQQVEAGISRTQPGHDGRPEVREIERLYLEMIAAAEHTLILENQYASSGAIMESLANNLRRERGPEILLILPRETSGWLETAAIGGLRRRHLQHLQNADLHGRFLACYPHRSGLDDSWITVHSKIGFADDRFVTVGSANLSNRSMGLDTECNLSVAAESQEHRRALRRFRARLLAEHLDTEPEVVAAHVERSGSVLDAVRTLGSHDRCLKPVQDDDEPAWILDLVTEEQLLDPERPIDPQELLKRIGGDGEEQDDRSRRGWKALLLLSIAILLTLAWRYSPMGESVDKETLRSWIAAYRDSGLALPATVGLFLLGGAVFFPVTLLILQTTAIFDPASGFLYALTGSLASAATFFAAGRWMGSRALRRITGDRSRRVMCFLARRGVLSVAAIRLTPIAPFTLVNLATGAAGIRWRPYLLGTLLGMMPGIAALTWLGGRLGAAIRDPSWTTIAAVAGVAALLLGLGKLIAGRTSSLSGATERP